MRNLLMELQESGFLKEPQITASSISFGGSGDMGLSEGTRNTSIVFISKLLPDDVCMRENCGVKAFTLAWCRQRDVGFKSESWWNPLLFYHLLVCDLKKVT